MKFNQKIGFFIFAVIAMVAMFFDASLTEGLLLAATPLAAAPADPKGPNPQASADEKGLDTDMTGTVASGSNVADSDLYDREIDEEIAKFRAYQTPFESLLRSRAKVYSVKGFEVDHFSEANVPLECNTTAAVAELTTNETVVLPIAAADQRMFAKHTTLAINVDGYAADGTTVKGKLCAIVLDKSSSAITIQPLNGKLDGTTMYVPAIPADTKVMIMANAVSESELNVAPSNQQPVKTTVYLQKSVSNVVFTRDFLMSPTKVAHSEREVMESALYDFKRKKERTYFSSVPSKFYVDSETMGRELVYTSEGIDTQITNLYGYGDTLAYSDLINISKLQFTKFSANNVAYAMCGKNFIAKLLNIKDIEKRLDAIFETSIEIGIDITAFRSTFGTLKFFYSQQMDDMGREDEMVVLDLDNAKRYVKEGKRTMTIDMSQGSGDNRDAKRKVYIEIDAICLRGFNSIRVAPVDTIMGQTGSTGNYPVVGVAALTDIDNPKTGQVVYLEADGMLYEYNGTTWVAYAE